MKINVKNKTDEKIYFVITTTDKAIYIEEIKEDKETETNETETNIEIKKDKIFNLEKWEIKNETL